MQDRTPVLHLLAGPNGAGKTTLAQRVIVPATRLPFVNADEIVVRDGLTGAEAAYEASTRAAAERRALFTTGTSFVTETVFSHTSKVQLVLDARAAGFRVALHVVMIPVDLSLRRVAERVSRGGHDVPADKIRQRHARLWPLVAEAIQRADETYVYDNSRAATPLRLIAHVTHGRLVGEADWPRWAPAPLRTLA